MCSFKSGIWWGEITAFQKDWYYSNEYLVPSQIWSLSCSIWYQFTSQIFAEFAVQECDKRRLEEEQESQGKYGKPYLERKRNHEFRYNWSERTRASDFHAKFEGKYNQVKWDGLGIQGPKDALRALERIKHHIWSYMMKKECPLAPQSDWHSKGKRTSGSSLNLDTSVHSETSWWYVRNPEIPSIVFIPIFSHALVSLTSSWCCNLYSLFVSLVLFANRMSDFPSNSYFSLRRCCPKVVLRLAKRCWWITLCQVTLKRLTGKT